VIVPDVGHIYKHAGKCCLRLGRISRIKYAGDVYDDVARDQKSNWSASVEPEIEVRRVINHTRLDRHRHRGVITQT